MPKKLIEAALFMSSRSMTSKEISKITGFPQDCVEQRLEELRKEYEGKGIEVVHNPDGWGMRVKTDLLPKVAHLTPYSELRDGHKRTLALIAYKEPIKQSEIIRIQGNKAYSYIKLLIKKGLIKSEKEGRTRILMLTKEFERYFGEEKQRIKEMLEQGLKEVKEKGKEEETQETEEEVEEKPDSDMTEIIPFKED
ncbi:MAG: SMC-Scp complex subunit ScpB [Candidatus Aenigmarchaeota archaeon]